MKKLWQEFKAFAFKGNVMDMAVGVVIGGAFSSVVTSLVDNILSPLIGLLCGDEFNNLCIKVLNVEIRYGQLIMSIINFLLVALVLFLVIKAFNTAGKRIKKEETPAAPTTKICPFCKSEIPLGAVRCPHCTSELPAEEPAAK